MAMIVMSTNPMTKKISSNAVRISALRKFRRMTANWVKKTSSSNFRLGASSLSIVSLNSLDVRWAIHFNNQTSSLNPRKYPRTTTSAENARLNQSSAVKPRKVSPDRPREVVRSSISLSIIPGVGEGSGVRDVTAAATSSEDAPLLSSLGSPVASEVGGVPVESGDAAAEAAAVWFESGDAVAEVVAVPLESGDNIPQPAARRRLSSKTR